MQSVTKNGIAKKGFTLIELLIVIAIIGLLATLAIVSLTTAQRKARDARRVADIKQLQNAVEVYYSEIAQYPLTAATSTLNSGTTVDTVSTWTDFGSTSVIGGYITNVPIDPTNNSTTGYIYTYGANAAGTEYFLSAKLEDTASANLNGDDDTLYNSATSGSWGATPDFVASSDTSANVARASLDCGTTTPDSTAGMYCVSE
jgi:type II secretion system protein G